MTRRWEYTDRAGEMTDVGADKCGLHESGALVFLDGDDLVFAVANGHWVTVEAAGSDE